MFSFFQSFSIPFLTAAVSSENLDVSGVTNSVVDLAEAIHTYGIAVVIFAVFLMVIIVLILVMTWFSFAMACLKYFPCIIFCHKLFWFKVKR